MSRMAGCQSFLYATTTKKHLLSVSGSSLGRHILRPFSYSKVKAFHNSFTAFLQLLKYLRRKLSLISFEYAGKSHTCAKNRSVPRCQRVSLMHIDVASRPDSLWGCPRQLRGQSSRPISRIGARHNTETRHRNTLARGRALLHYF